MSATTLAALALALAAQVRSPNLSEERIVLEKSLGELVIALYPEIAPRHAAQLLRMTRAGVYDGMDFFRVEPSFVAQCCVVKNRVAPLTPEQQATITRIPAEFSGQQHVRGTVTMARYDDDLDSATTSFSIVLGPSRHLDRRYTVVGRLEEGWDTLARIERVAREGNKPERRLNIVRATVREPPPSATGRAFLTAGLGVLVLALAGSVIAWRLGRPRLRSAAMVVMLVSFFFALMGAMWARIDVGHSAGLLMFLGAVALFRYLATFEGPAKTRGA